MPSKAKTRHLDYLATLFILTFCFLSPARAGSFELDNTFGNGAGKNITSFGGFSDDVASDIAIQADGKLIVVGNRNNNNVIDTAIVRYKADGTLDTNFNGTGIVLTSFSTSKDEANAVAIQLDGKIVVGGISNQVGTTFGDFMILRYLQNGALDTNFGNNGIVLTDFGTNSNDYLLDMVIQPDGKILTVGYTSPSFNDMAFARYNSDGSLDTGFGAAGTGKFVLSTVGGNDDFATKVALQSDGKIVVAAYTGSTIRRTTLLRFLPNGTLDSSFDGDGWVFYIGSTPQEVGISLALQTDGKIIAGMSVFGSSNNNNFGLIRFNNDGSLDNSFGNAGLVTTDVGGFNDYLRDIVLLPDGKIIAAGASVASPSPQNFSLVKYNSDGSLDSSYGNSGKVFTTITGIADAITEMALQPDGKVAVSGISLGNQSGRDFTIVRYERNGSLDLRFGEVGLVHSSLRNKVDEVKDAALQMDGKIVAAGFSHNPSSQIDCAIARYSSDGSIDTTFGSQGRVILSLNSLDDGLNAVALQPDGKIVATGYSGRLPNADVAVLRFNNNGTLDATFSDDGIIIIPISSSADVGNDIIVEPDGKILVGGYSFISIVSQFTVLKFNSNGTPDTAFGANGMVQTSFDVWGGLARAMARQPDGKLLLAGDYLGPDPRDFALVRYNPDGSLDNTFGSGGKVTTPVGNSEDQANALTLLSDGKIVLAGFSASTTVFDFSVVRYNQDGTLDTTFDFDGKVLTPIVGDSIDYAYSVIAQTNGKIIVGGTSTEQSNDNTNITLVRYNLNGSLDPSFGVEGKLITDYGKLGESVNSMVLQPNGRLILGGGVNKNSVREFALLRYLDTLPKRPIFDFDGDGKTDVSIFRPTVGEWWYLRSSDGSNRAFQFGTSTDKILPADYTGDGKSDIAFWRESSGEWFVLRSEDSSFYSFPFGGPGDTQAPADYDGDGKTDPAIFRPASATWYILNSSGGTTIQTFGANGDRPVPADYDGDGKADLAIFRPSDGSWWLNRSQAGIIVLNFGTSTDKTVQGDYTGDGKADVAFFRPSSGEWFISRSEDFSFYSFPFGSAGDIPAPGDYDGDGRFDPTVFRPSNSTWFKLQSTSGFEAITFGISGDVPVPSAFVR